MKYRLFMYQLICLFALYGCSNQKQIESITVLNHKNINLGNDYIGYGGFLSFHQDSIVGLDLSPSMPPFFCIMSDGSSQTSFNFGNRGQGPDDFLRPHTIQHINNQTIGVFDMMSRTYSEFRIPNEYEELKIDKKVNFQTQLYQIVKTSFDQYIGLSTEKEMFLLTDSAGVPVGTFFEYPYKDGNERQFVSRSHAYQGVLATNTSKNKFVYSPFQGDIIHFYKIEYNRIKPIAKIENEYPIYKKRDDNNEGVMFNANTKIGYIATYATDKFVYAIFSGISVIEQKSINFEGEILRIFDWNGTLVKEYKLDIPCSYLCVSDDDSKIWAIASNPDIILVSFDLEKHNDKTHKELDAKIMHNVSTISNTNTILDTNKTSGIKIAQDVKIKKISDLKDGQLVEGRGNKFVFEVTKDGGSDSEMQNIRDSIITQMTKGNELNISNVDTKYDTLPDNTIKIQIRSK